MFEPASWSRPARRARPFLLALLLPATSAAQTGAADTVAAPALADLPLRRVLDVDSVLTRFVASRSPSPEDADAALLVLIEGGARPDAGTYYWILYGAPSGPDVKPPVKLSSVVYAPCLKGSWQAAELYDADRLAVLVLLPQKAYRGDVKPRQSPIQGRKADPARERLCGPRRAPDRSLPVVVDATVGAALFDGRVVEPPADAIPYAVRAGTVVRVEASPVAGGASEFLALLLSGAIRLLGSGRAGLAEQDSLVPIPAFDVALLTTEIPVRNASLRATVQVLSDTMAVSALTHVMPQEVPLAATDSVNGESPAGSEGAEGGAESLPASIRHHLRQARVEILLDYVGYTAEVGKLFDALQRTLAGPPCARAGNHGDSLAVHGDSLAVHGDSLAVQPGLVCLLALRQSLVSELESFDLQAEHRARAVQRGAREVLAVFEALVGSPRMLEDRTFRVASRSPIGFSAGGVVDESAAGKLEFEAKDGEIVADGLEGDGFRSLALVDFYFRPVDLAKADAAFLPHLSLGLSVGKEFRPVAGVGLPLCFVNALCVRRVSLVGGALIRREEQAEQSAIDANLRIRWFWGLKVALPVSP